MAEYLPLVLRIYLARIIEILSSVVFWIFPATLSKFLLSSVDHYAYHLSASTRFEGFYTRIQTEDDSTIAIIISSVHGAKAWGSKSHFLHFSLTPSKRSKMQPIRIDCHPDQVKYFPLGKPLRDGRQTFRLQADNFAMFYVARDHQYYWLALPDSKHPGGKLIVSVRLTSRTPLRPDDPQYTPHNQVVRLGSLIPVHWHVFSTHSRAKYMVTRRHHVKGPEGAQMRVEEIVTEGTGRAHMEKNWGKGFPDGWTWLQGFSSVPSEHPPVTIAIAGGSSGIPGVQSYLVIYRSPETDLLWDFAVPWACMIGLSNGLARSLLSKVRVHRDTSQVDIQVSTLTRRLVISARSDEDASKWLPLDCPLITGHGNITSRESFAATIDVRAYIRAPIQIISPLGGWKLVEHRIFRDAAFELGGSYRNDAMRELDRAMERVKKEQ